MSRTLRTQIAQETVRILEQKRYANPAGQSISIARELDACLAGTQLIALDDWAALESRVAKQLALRPQSRPADLHVYSETTFRTCQRWVADQNLQNVACLNFASAKNPGGGFLAGSQAQEEALSRASGLYASLLTSSGYYEFNRKSGTCLYSDHMIWSPGVPVIRDDADQLLPQPYIVSIITSPAVNAGCIRTNEPKRIPEIGKVMRVRARKVLALAVDQGVEHLVLGAWGCGVFANDPTEVAEIFAELLKPGGEFATAFTQVAFSVPGGGASSGNLAAFERIFHR
ncbi:MAG: TIGR02452 family protein [Bacteroidia bacterium]